MLSCLGVGSEAGCGLGGCEFVCLTIKALTFEFKSVVDMQKLHTQFTKKILWSRVLTSSAFCIYVCAADDDDDDDDHHQSTETEGVMNAMFKKTMMVAAMAAVIGSYAVEAGAVELGCKGKGKIVYNTWISYANGVQKVHVEGTIHLWAGDPLGVKVVFVKPAPRTGSRIPIGQFETPGYFKMLGRSGNTVDFQTPYYQYYKTNGSHNYYPTVSCKF